MLGLSSKLSKLIKHFGLRQYNKTNNKMSTICDESPKIWPRLEGTLPTLSDYAKGLLLTCTTVDKPSTAADSVDLDKLKKLSEEFPIKFPTDNCRVKAQPLERMDLIRQQIASAYPIIHERALLLFLNFLEHKQKFGNSTELNIYKNLSLTDFVQRLLTKRCVYFFNSFDSYLLLSGSNGSGGFDHIGSDAEEPPLVLKDVLSYDEIKLSALLYVSSHSEFINDGSRANVAIVEHDKSKIEREGVMMGLIGARFERPNVMECQDILITVEQNTPDRGYGNSSSVGISRQQDYRRIWREFYEEPKDFCFNEASLTDKRFVHLFGKGAKFDNVVMGKRYAISFDTLLLEAEARAAAAGKPAYIHVVGIGLGVWKVSPHQEEIFLEIFEQRLLAFSERLSHIGVVHFSWFHLDQWCGIHDGAIINGIEVRISKRNPAEKLAKDMLPLVTYAWDGNALPGNEFWARSLQGTGDPAAACSTLITELQNAHINKDYMSGTNLHIASLQHGVLHVSDYAKKLL